MNEEKYNKLEELIKREELKGITFPFYSFSEDVGKVSICSWCSSSNSSISNENKILSDLVVSVGLIPSHGICENCKNSMTESSYKNIFKLSSNEKNQAFLKFSMQKTLYHGTTIDKAKKITEEGLWPQTGDFTSQFYGDEDGDEDDENYDNGDLYYEDQYKLEELIFAADKEEIDKAVTAMVAQIAVKLNKDLHHVTDAELLRNGALVVIRDAGWTQRPIEDEDYKWEREYGDGSYRHVEPGDHYSDRDEPFSYILTGKKMFSVLRRLGSLPRDWGPDEDKNNKQRLIELVRRARPNLNIEDVVEKINTLDSGTIRQQIRLFENEE